MNNNISELLKSHCSIFGSNLQNVKLPLGTDKSVQGIFQLDFLSWYVPNDKIQSYWVPWFDLESWIKDNPNWVPTEFENVYIKTEYHGENVSIDYQLVIPNKSPVAIMNRRYFKVRCWKSYEYRWRVCIYWKALRLYYMGYIQRLLDYVVKYQWECCRADLCWDFPKDIPDWVINLNLTWTNHKTRYFWEKNSPMFFRIYDKTQDLKREKNCFSRLYPKWYMKECRRLECQLSWLYSRSMTPLDWLDIMQVDKSIIQKVEQIDRNVYKTALYSVINCVDWVNLSIQEKMNILINSKKLIEQKINKLKKQDL